MKLMRISVIVALLLVVVGGYGYQYLKLEYDNFISDDPRVWEDVILGFEQQDSKQALPANSVLFLGSSSIRMWDTLTEDMAPLTAIGRGFGGAKIPDLIYYLDRLVSPHQSSAVVIYIGSNDFSEIADHRAKTPEQAHKLYRQLVLKLQTLTSAPIYFIALKPTTQNWSQWPMLSGINQFLSQLCQEDKQLHFIDANAGLYNEQYEPESDYLMWDGVHLSDAGYEVWASPIKQQLLQALP